MLGFVVGGGKQAAVSVDVHPKLLGLGRMCRFGRMLLGFDRVMLGFKSC
jgi:hypothetical protein